jgi:hypothetical protein
LKGYFAASLISVSIALLSRRAMVSTLKSLKGSTLTFANSSLTYVAAALAGGANLALMRYKEREDGISI